MAPATSSEIAKAIVRMFAGYLSIRLDEDQMRAAVASYVEQVAEQPLWAIEKACKELGGKGGAFPPSAGDIREKCLQITAPAWAEYSDLNKILKAEVFTPDPERAARAKAIIAGAYAPMPSRERVQEMVDDFKAGIPQENIDGPKWRKPRSRREEDEIRQAALDALDDAPGAAKKPLTISPTLMRQFAGELPIGAGKTGARPLMTPTAIDQFAKDHCR